MAVHIAIVKWNRHGEAFTDRRYSRSHEWHFDGGTVVPASSSPDVVPVPYSNGAHVDPEEAFIAALSSCHMLWFLDLAARAGYVVDDYTDRSEGYLEKDSTGKSWVSKVVLGPAIRFSGDKVPHEDAVRELHHQAHVQCFIANSVKTELLVHGAWEYAAAASASGQEVGSTGLGRRLG